MIDFNKLKPKKNIPTLATTTAPDKKILIVVDMQYDFCKPDGALYNPEAEKIIPNIVEAVRKHILKYGTKSIFFTADNHMMHHARPSIEMQRIPMHCIHNTKGAAIVDELAPFIDDEIISIWCKHTFACFDLAYSIDKYMEDASLTSTPKIEICGVCTDICVISNALYLRSKYPDVEITVRDHLCAGTSPEAHEAALKVMENCLINVIR